MDDRRRENIVGDVGRLYGWCLENEGMSPLSQNGLGRSRGKSVLVRLLPRFHPSSGRRIVSDGPGKAGFEMTDNEQEYNR